MGVVVGRIAVEQIHLLSKVGDKVISCEGGRGWRGGGGGGGEGGEERTWKTVS